MPTVRSTAERIASALKKRKKKTVTYDELANAAGLEEYRDTHACVQALMETKAIGAFGKDMNGRVPPLPKRYRILLEKEGPPDRTEEIRGLYPIFRTKQYLESPGRYEKDRDIIKPLSDYLYRHGAAGIESEAIERNERSLKIFGNEKFIRGDRKDNRARIARVLRENGLAEDFLNYYETSEPLPFFFTKTRNGKALIVENKATFGSLRKLNREMALPYSAVVFGYGNKAAKPSRIDRFLLETGEDLGVEIVSCEYFGDIDREGIGILKRVQNGNETTIVPAKALYRALAKYGRNENIQVHEEQKPGAPVSVLGLDEEETASIEKILSEGRFIPQEVLDKTRLREVLGGKREDL